MAALRNPDGGCPWDLEQDFKSIAPYTIEEAYEVADAIEREDMADLKDELGDLLLQVVYHAQMAKEEELFNFDDITAHVSAKMIHRHPHVFGEDKAESADDVMNNIWEQRKDQEKGKRDSILDGVTKALPALLRAQKLQKRAARVNFEWPNAHGVLDKLEEEIAEMREAVDTGGRDELEDELGDLFFVLVNYGRMMNLDCEAALRRANDKFERRFRGMERTFKERGESMEGSSLDQMEQEWIRQKQLEKTGF